MAFAPAGTVCGILWPDVDFQNSAPSRANANKAAIIHRRVAFTRSRFAYTLLEVLVAASLVILTLGLAMNFLIPALRHAAWGLVRVGLQQEAMMALQRICRDLQTTVPKGVTVSYANPLLIATNPYQVSASEAVLDPAGTVVWEKSFWVVSYDPALRQLRRRRWPEIPALGGGDPALPGDLDTTLTAKAIPRGLLADIVAAPARWTILAHDVKEFRIEPSQADVELRQPLRFTVVLEKEAAGQAAPLRVEASRSVFMAGSQ